MEIMQIVIIGIITAILAITVKKQSPDMAAIISIAGSVLIFVTILPMLSGVIGILSSIESQISIDTAYVVIVIKVIGVAYIAEFGAQICADAGETSLASKIEMSGKIIIMVLSAPIIVSMLDMILAILPS
ncbi:MAG: stage III sporulation protein AD [Defluviitaleaceae bacterium]|nr:stage III sporulation protein AD [Defluviitaleaceae bacterium]